ncbi:MAG: pectinacetylesterase family protein [Marinobacter sp.]|nr:pectinacetylesterase family protein [Marinobacter sp.]
MKTSIRCRWLAGLLALGLSFSVHAELGDYGFWRTLGNLVSPPRADNPVRAEDRLGEYPLLTNPSGFRDGFSPGNYYAWQTIQLSPQTGAVCGDGSPYKFFVNRVPNTSNTVLYFEGGGACWDYESCSGQSGIRGARNPNGIPDDYMSLLNPGASLASPFVVRLHPWSRVKTQSWNMVYVPYCTGDIYSGDTVAIYEDPAGEAEPLVWHHNGLRNGRAVMAWLRDNLQRSGQMLSTGCSAGGVGSLTSYEVVRADLAATRGFLINDSGPIFPTPRGADPAEYPSVLLHTLIRDVWGLDRANGPLDFIKSYLPGLDLNDLGSLYPAMSSARPNDRMGHTHFWRDLNYSSYSYERFYEEIFNEPDQAVRESKILARWQQDTGRQLQQLANLANVGYFYPQFRAVNESHCTTIVEFANSDIQELGLELDDFIRNVLNGSGAVMQASETDPTADFNKPFNLLYWLLDQLI